MNNFIDKYGRIHDAPVTVADPLPSNNAWIYSAYYVKLGGKLEIQGSCIDACLSLMQRHPDVALPPMSRDEVLGLAYLGYPLKGWNFSPWPLPRLNPIKLIIQLWRLRGLHRNHFWKNPGFEQVYHVAFSVPLSDRAFILRCRGEKVPLVYRLIEAVDKRVKPKNKSSALIRGLKYNIWPGIDVFKDYFGDDNHPIVVAALEAHLK